MKGKITPGIKLKLKNLFEAFSEDGKLFPKTMESMLKDTYTGDLHNLLLNVFEAHEKEYLTKDEFINYFEENAKIDTNSTLLLLSSVGIEPDENEGAEVT